jgi:hypothetical protein
MRNQRYVPILSGIFDLVIVLGLLLFWSPESGGFWWWVRGVPLALFLYMGIGSLKRGFFASDTEVARMVAGEYWFPPCHRTDPESIATGGVR